MRKLVRLTAVIAALLLASGVPAYARGGGGGGGGGGGHGGGGGGGAHGGGGGHAFGGGHGGGGGHAFGGPHDGFGGHHGFEGHHGFDGHHDFDGHHGFRGRGFVGFGPSFYWDPYWDEFGPYAAYGPYAYSPAPPPVYIEKPQAGYCPSARASYPAVRSCAEPWIPAAPHTG